MPRPLYRRAEHPHQCPQRNPNVSGGQWRHYSYSTYLQPSLTNPGKRAQNSLCGIASLPSRPRLYFKKSIPPAVYGSTIPTKKTRHTVPPPPRPLFAFGDGAGAGDGCGGDGGAGAGGCGGEGGVGFGGDGDGGGGGGDGGGDGGSHFPGQAQSPFASILYTKLGFSPEFVSMISVGSVAVSSQTNVTTDARACPL